ncbi:MAG: hypothetical protein IH988_00700 [Planctomycetes bacterium]|nr:hypothetical protein [Planctomycetota bacterium]
MVLDILIRPGRHEPVGFIDSDPRRLRSHHRSRGRGHQRRGRSRYRGRRPCSSSGQGGSRNQYRERERAALDRIAGARPFSGPAP